MSEATRESESILKGYAQILFITSYGIKELKYGESKCVTKLKILTGQI